MKLTSILEIFLYCSARNDRCSQLHCVYILMSFVDVFHCNSFPYPVLYGTQQKLFFVVHREAKSAKFSISQFLCCPIQISVYIEILCETRVHVVRNSMQ